MTIGNWLESSRCPRLPISKILKDLITRLNNVILYSQNNNIFCTLFNYWSILARRIKLLRSVINTFIQKYVKLLFSTFWIEWSFHKYVDKKDSSLNYPYDVKIGYINQFKDRLRFEKFLDDDFHLNKSEIRWK